jgi:hypothetical protein
MSSPSRCDRGHHREAHRFGDEAAWWKNAGVDPTIAARALWLETHPAAENFAQNGTDGATCQGEIGDHRPGRADAPAQ